MVLVAQRAAAIGLCSLASANIAILPVLGLDNGVGTRPPMGFLSWEKFRCNLDCENDPQNCISEQLYKEQATALIEGGFAAAGYNRVNIDDCWALPRRDKDGLLVADPSRFPSGIKGLADWMHERHLRLGLYSAMGEYTCSSPGGFPGLACNGSTVCPTAQRDVDTFVSWGIDGLKVDGCKHDDPLTMNLSYPLVGRYIAEAVARMKTQRPVLYSCSWGHYVERAGLPVPFRSLARHCNLWRNYLDVQDNWDSVAGIIEFFHSRYDYGLRRQSGDPSDFAAVAGPGSFNDADMLVIGNSLTTVEEETQMAMWSIFASPLYISTDLRTISNQSRAILLNPEAIAINQDVLGRQGSRVWQKADVQLWRRSLAGGAVAAVLYNSGNQLATEELALNSVGFAADTPVEAREVFGDKAATQHAGGSSIGLQVAPHGVRMFRLRAV